MTDAARIIGVRASRDRVGPTARLPSALKQVMGSLTIAEHIAIGARSIRSASSPSLAGTTKHILTRDPDYRAPVNLARTQVCRDFVELVERFSDSEDVLNVIGGATVFSMFLPHANRLDIGESGSPLPGDHVFDAWEHAGFQTAIAAEWTGGRTLRLTRPAGPLADHRRKALALLDLAANRCRPDAAGRLFLAPGFSMSGAAGVNAQDSFVHYFRNLETRFPGKDLAFRSTLCEDHQVAVAARVTAAGHRARETVFWLQFDRSGKIDELHIVDGSSPESERQESGSPPELDIRTG